MPRDADGNDNPNWWMIGIFVVSGTGLLVVAYYMSSYWQGVLDNGGTSLFLFALLVFSEPRLIRHLRQPRTLGEAITRFNALAVQPLPGLTKGGMHIKDQVLRAVGRTGLHQEPPNSSSARFTNLSRALEIEWNVEWDDEGLRHLVIAGGRKLPRPMSRRISWDQGIAVHEEHVYKILCYLLHELEPHS